MFWFGRDLYRFSSSKLPAVGRYIFHCRTGFFPALKGSVTMHPGCPPQPCSALWRSWKMRSQLEPIQPQTVSLADKTQYRLVTWPIHSLGWVSGQIFNGVEVSLNVYSVSSSLTSVMKGCNLRGFPGYTTAVQWTFTPGVSFYISP